MTDGKLRVPNPLNGKLVAKPYWDGNTLVIEKFQETDQGRMDWLDRYSLSKDGQSLAVTYHATRASFSVLDESLIYEKKD